LHSSIATDEAWAGEIDGRGRANCCGMKKLGEDDDEEKEVMVVMEKW
jgi:hypothetical protein